jgi:hypothetical protein
MKTKKHNSAHSNHMNLMEYEVAERLRVETKTLRNWRSVGKGPRYMKIGHRVLYPEAELAAYERKNLRPTEEKRRKR